ncbi:DUF885 domain-containing protein [Streptomyces laurentii]|uniref:DUF885 domain-containing protein n=1 Tax=Streptomyces laurentii TaxID=39478 RepID=UPI0036AA5A29
MSEPSSPPSPAKQAGARIVRETADSYVRRLAELDPLVATYLGLPFGQDQLPDLSPDGRAAGDDLARTTLRELDALERAAAATDGLSDAERRCGRLLRERLGAELAISVDDEYLREVVNIFGLQQRVQGIFLMMPTATADDWALVAARLGRVPGALADQRRSLDTALSEGRFTAGPRQVRTVADQLDAWVRDEDGLGWYAGLVRGADVPPPLRAELERVAAAATASVAALRDWLREVYLPKVQDNPDGVGARHYRTWARFWNGADLDLSETYAWGWSQYRELRAQAEAEAQKVLPGSTTREAMRHLDEHGEAVEGVEEIRLRLQGLMDEAISDLDGTYFDIAAQVKEVEARIAPSGSAAAPYYTSPSQDFSRPGRTWLPTMGRTRFPLWSLRSVWYHEGVPGHHLHLAQWKLLGDELSMYQTGIGGIDACKEGWALYAERLMDELGYLRTPGDRLGFLDWQMMRAIRVVVDLGMHLGLTIPEDSPVGAGLAWTPELAREFLLMHSGQTPEFVDSEIGRYLGLPGQAISYKLGERAWLSGLEAAKAAHAARGARFDLKSWHMQALSLGSLGLDDLSDELAGLPYRTRSQGE